MTFVVGLGANLGSRLASLRAAVHLLGADARTTIEAVSSIYETAPIGPAQPDFLNGAVRLRTERSAYELLDLVQSVEERLGRVRTIRWGPRVIDLDILTGPRPVSDPPTLEIPHPQLHVRAFARTPWSEVTLDPIPDDTPKLSPSPWSLSPGPATPATAIGPDRIDALAMALTSLGGETGSTEVLTRSVDGPEGAVGEVMRLRAARKTFRSVTLSKDSSGKTLVRLVGLAEGPLVTESLLPVSFRPATEPGWQADLGANGRTPPT